MMHAKTLISAGLLAMSSAAIAQLATAPDPKLGNAQTDNAQAANVADNTEAAQNMSDPGKR